MSKSIKTISYFCHRCREKFETKEDLIIHWKSQIKFPCDNICSECGIILSNKKAHWRHYKSECEYMPKQKTIDRIIERNKIENYEESMKPKEDHLQENFTDTVEESINTRKVIVENPFEEELEIPEHIVLEKFVEKKIEEKLEKILKRFYDDF